MTASTENILAQLPEKVAILVEKYGISVDDFKWEGEIGPHLFGSMVLDTANELLSDLSVEEQQQVAAGRPSDNCYSWFQVRDDLREETAQPDLAVVTTVLYFYAHVMGVGVQELD